MCTCQELHYLFGAQQRGDLSSLCPALVIFLKSMKPNIFIIPRSGIYIWICITLCSLTHTSHLNTPVFFPHQDQFIIPERNDQKCQNNSHNVKQSENEFLDTFTWIHTKSEQDLFRAESHQPFKLRSNLFRSFCVILLRKQPTKNWTQVKT